MCAYLFVCTPHVCSVLGGHKRAPEALKLELAHSEGCGVGGVVRCLIEVSRTEPSFSARAASKPS